MSGPRLLLAEDDPSLRELLREGLEEAGFVVAAAADGAEALDLLGRAESYDVLLLDDDMPRLSGRQLLAALRAAGSRVPAVLYSGRLELDEEECARLGIGPVLRKPLPLEDLVEALRRAMLAAGPEV